MEFSLSAALFTSRAREVKEWLFVGVQTVCSGVSTHVHRRPFEVQDEAGAGRAGGAIHRSGPGTALLSHPCYRVHFKDVHKSQFEPERQGCCEGMVLSR